MEKSHEYLQNMVLAAIIVRLFTLYEYPQLLVLKSNKRHYMM